MLPLHRERRYVFGVYARAARALDCDVSLRVASSGGEVASARLRVPGPSWTECSAELHVADGPQAGELCYLAVTFQGPGTLWLDQAALLPADAKDGLDPDVVRLTKAAGTTLLRFPGGNFASGYHWRDGIGPRDKRVSMLNPAWGGIETNQFGTHEWMAFCEAVGAEPFICVNCGNGTPEEAADWIRYCNEPPDGELGRLRAENGHPEPYGVRFWEVGNELWGDWQVGHCTPEEYAGRYDAFAQAMLAADPSIQLIANGGDGDWNPRFLGAVTQPVRSLSIHRLIGWGVPADADPQDVFLALAGYGTLFDEQLASMQQLMRDHGIAEPKLALTELMSTAHVGPDRSWYNFLEVPYFAGMMNACIRRRHAVELITRTAVVNHGGGLAKVREVTFPEPVHFLSRIYGSMSGRWPVACSVTCPQYDVDVKGLPVLSSMPALECMALLNDDGDELTLIVTNRDPRNAYAAAIDLSGFTPTKGAKVRTLAAPPTAINTWDNPDQVALAEGTADAAPTFDHTFPPGRSRRSSWPESILKAAEGFLPLANALLYIVWPSLYSYE